MDIGLLFDCAVVVHGICRTCCLRACNVEKHRIQCSRLFRWGIALIVGIQDSDWLTGKLHLNQIALGNGV